MLHLRLCRIESLTLLHMAAGIVGGKPFYVAGNLFAIKHDRIRHFGLKIGRASFWWGSAVFWIQKFKKSPKWDPKIQGCGIAANIRPLVGMHHTDVRSGDGNQSPHIQMQISTYVSRYPDSPDVRISRYQVHVSDIRYQVSGIRRNKWKV